MEWNYKRAWDWEHSETLGANWLYFVKEHLERSGIYSDDVWAEWIRLLVAREYPDIAQAMMHKR